VDTLDLERNKAYVRKVDVDYFTDAMTYTNVRVIDGFASATDRDIIREHGEVQVVRKVVGYKKIKFYTAENLGYGDVVLPEKDMHTTSYWFTIPRDLLDRLECRQSDIIDGLAGVAYSLHHLASMLLMCDMRDIDRCIGDKSGEWFVRHGSNQRMIAASRGEGDTAAIRIDDFDPTIFIFDAYPGGIGFSDLLYESHDQLLAAARNLIETCPCAHGCPTCVGPTLEVGPLAKGTALAIIDLVTGKR